MKQIISLFFDEYPTKDPANRKVWFLNAKGSLKRYGRETAIEKWDEIAWIPATFAYKVLAMLQDFQVSLNKASTIMKQWGMCTVTYPIAMHAYINEMGSLPRSFPNTMVYKLAHENLITVAFIKRGKYWVQEVLRGSAQETGLRTNGFKQLLPELTGTQNVLLFKNAPAA